MRAAVSYAAFRAIPHARTRCLYNSAVSRMARSVHRPYVLARAIAATLSASLVLGLGGCATPMLDSTVSVPDQFAAAPASETEPEVAWWESYGDPVLSDLDPPRRARESRRQDRSRARARRARRRDDQPLVAAAERRRDRQPASISAPTTARPCAAGCSRTRRAGSGGLDVSWEIDLAGACAPGAAAAAADTLAAEAQRARRAPARAERRRDQLLHARRRAAPARDRARDLGRAGRNAAPRDRAAARRASRRRSTSSARRPTLRARARRYRRSRRSPPSRVTASPC